MFRLSRLFRLVVLALMLLAPGLPPLHSVAHAQGSKLEVIKLKYRTAEQVIPVLKPLLAKDGTLSGLQYQLLIRTTPASLADMKKALETIDAVPRRLLITVRQDAALENDRRSASLSGRPPEGNETVVAAGASVASTRSLSSDNNTQTLQMLEGGSAFIRTGQSVPAIAPQQSFARTAPGGRVVGQAVVAPEYREVMSGFHATARLDGDRVMLEISPQRDTPANPEQNLAPGSINMQRASTTVHGRLGEWIEIGGVSQGLLNRQSGVLGNTRELSGENRRILIRVEEIR